MNTLLTLLASTAALVAVVSGIQLTVLAFRNPFRPAWLKKPGADNLASMMIVASLSFVTAFEITGIAAAGVNAFVATCLTAALILGVAIFNWRIFRCRERLRRTDAGQSPFEPLAAAPKLQRASAHSG